MDEQLKRTYFTENKTRLISESYSQGKEQEPVARGAGGAETSDKLQIAQQLLGPCWVVVLLRVV